MPDFSSNSVNVFLSPVPSLLTTEEEISLVEFLSSPEKERLTEFSHPPSRLAYLLAHSMVRFGLSQLFDKPTSQIHAFYPPKKRPIVFIDGVQDDWHASISHSDLMVAVALSHLNVGIDVESQDFAYPLEAGMNTYYSPNEISYVNGFFGRDRLDAYQKLWTLKEAYLKATGIAVTQLRETHDFVVGDVVNPQLKPRNADHHLDHGANYHLRLDRHEKHVVGLVAQRRGYNPFGKQKPFEVHYNRVGIHSRGLRLTHPLVRG